MLTNEKINELIGVKESYQASDKLANTLFDKEAREDLFREFLKLESDLSFDWFHDYFQDEHADRRLKKQDFTPNTVSDILAKLTGPSKVNLDVCAGIGGLTIRKWWNDGSIDPQDRFYFAEELSDRAMPFLLFNLMIRGMNALVTHGDSLVSWGCRINMNEKIEYIVTYHDIYGGYDYFILEVGDNEVETHPYHLLGEALKYIEKYKELEADEFCIASITRGEVVGNRYEDPEYLDQ
ncbi:N-6 DNA methylase [Listeria ilorinensis]|uniref:N-6 DNA methylase n=1 Tax=Listeria ilorinensis TaxID=2867439 RepID=UPI001EF54648|nr:N-6 DNA methylase [Listeria ilorinensis]